MKYSFHLRNAQTNETKIITQDCDERDEKGIIWHWTQGNYSCDCNRSLEFFEDENLELDCNTGENIIVLDKIVREDGATLWDRIEARLRSLDEIVAQSQEFNIGY